MYVGAVSERSWCARACMNFAKLQRAHAIRTTILYTLCTESARPPVALERPPQEWCICC